MNRYIAIFLLFTVFFLSSCEKFLFERHTSSITNPKSLQDLQAMLDAGNAINYGKFADLHEVLNDDFFVSETWFNQQTEFDKSSYLRLKSNFDLTSERAQWRDPYRVIAIANTILEEIPKVSGEDIVFRNSIKGSALFLRAFTFLNLASIYCKTYDPKSAKLDLGLPLRLSTDNTIQSVRSNLEETYQRIEKDLIEAFQLLPIKSTVQTRPDKSSAAALLSRLYLMMGRYEDCLDFSNKSLEISSELLDFNLLNAYLDYPIPIMNIETLFLAYPDGSFIIFNARGGVYIDNDLVESYHEDDLRKTIFFKSEGLGLHSFRGSFMGNYLSYFNGLTVSEVLLNRAECYARLGNVQSAFMDLNRLLSFRYKTGELIPFSQTNTLDVLDLILIERRKELLNRGTRWTDLKRLNLDPKYAKILRRKKPGGSEIFELHPNDSRYVFQIPQSVIEMTGMKQNP